MSTSRSLEEKHADESPKVRMNWTLQSRFLSAMTSLPLLLTLLCLPMLSSACDYDGSSNLYCSSLGLIEIPENKFGTEIKMFEFTANKLYNLENNGFLEYSSVSFLYLYSNEISEVGMDAFEGLDELRFLDLSENKITTLYSDTFKENTKLTVLSLKSNPMKLSTPFLNSKSINSLELTKCNLTSINANSFDGLPNLETLFLRENLLEYLPLDLFENLPKLKKIYLHGNPWRCGGAMEELMQSKQDLIADRKKMHCVTSDGEQQVWSQGSWKPATTSSETSNKEAPETSNSKDVAASQAGSTKTRRSEAVRDIIAEPAKLIMSTAHSGAADFKDMEMTTVVIEDADDDYITDDDDYITDDDDVENDDADDDDDDDVAQVTQQISTTGVYIIVMIIAVILLLIGVVSLIVQRCYGCIKCKTASIESYDNKEYQEDEYNGYLIPRSVMIPGSVVALQRNEKEDIYFQHIYETIK